MAKDDKKTEENTEEQIDEHKRSKIKGYEKLIDRLKSERAELQNELNRDYREARRYVRSHPEEGVLVAFVGGLALGFILGKIGK